MFENKHIVVGICGGIAAYKAAGLVSQLRQQGADVHCIMTKNAAKLVTPITFGELSSNDVTVDMFANISKWDVEHIALARLADVFVIAPATADIIGKVANGIADDMLSTTIPHSSFLTPNFSKPHPFARSLATDTRGGAAIPLKAQGTICSHPTFPHRKRTVLSHSPFKFSYFSRSAIFSMIIWPSSSFVIFGYCSMWPSL